jgi:hypothetical protein
MEHEEFAEYEKRFDVVAVYVKVTKKKLTISKTYFKYILKQEITHHVRS